MTDEHHPRLGERAPDFALPDLGGTIVSLADVLREHQVVVHFVREFS